MSEKVISASQQQANQDRHEGITQLVLVRHAETEANVQQVWQGALDAPLTARGEAQVAATAARLADLHHEQPFDYFYVSPLPRALHTARPIADAIGMEIVVDEGLREFDLGDWEGRSFEELREVEKLWQRWDADPSFAPPNGESPLGFYRRARQALHYLVAQHPAARLLVVTHGGFISSVLASWLGESPGDWRAFDPHNCAITILDHQREEWHGRQVNDASHLPASARADYVADY